MIAPTQPTQAMSASFEQAREFFTQGLAHYEAGRLEQAERDFAASLSLLPGRVSTLTNLGATRLKLGRPQEAADLLAEALAQEPQNVEALGHRATALAEMGLPGQALASVEEAIRLAPGTGALWSLRGNLLKELGRLPEARDSLATAIARGADNELTRYYLASLTGRDAPATAPREYVQALFDGYADGFEEHLLRTLKYQAHEVLVAGLARMQRRFASALDLGCGTGLCGLAARPLVDRLDGVDLSSHMVERARSRGVYESVVQADLVQHLNGTMRRYDLVLAADVFIYVGALEAVFDAVTRVMEPGGVFCFSVEASGEDAGIALRGSLRYAHSPGYIRSLAQHHGFEFAETQEHPIREDQRLPVAGWFAWLLKR